MKKSKLLIHSNIYCHKIWDFHLFRTKNGFPVLFDLQNRRKVIFYENNRGALAQLARASHWQCEGQRFKSAMLHHDVIFKVDWFFRSAFFISGALLRADPHFARHGWRKISVFFRNGGDFRTFFRRIAGESKRSFLARRNLPAADHSVPRRFKRFPRESSPRNFYWNFVICGSLLAWQ